MSKNTVAEILKSFFPSEIALNASFVFFFYLLPFSYLQKGEKQTNKLA